MESFNTFDLFFAVLLLASGIFAFRRGLVKEIFSLGTWIGATIIALSFYPSLKPWVMEKWDIKNELSAGAIAGLGLFGLSLLVLIPLGSLLANVIKGPTLTSIDRSLGFVFGLLRGLLVLSLIYLAVSAMFPEKDDQPKWLSEAKTAPLLADGADMLKSFVPKDEREELEEELEENREQAQQAIEDAKHLDEISMPVPASNKADEKKPSSYQEDIRGVLDNLTGSKDEQK